MISTLRSRSSNLNFRKPIGQFEEVMEELAPGLQGERTNDKPLARAEATMKVIL